MEDPRIRKFAKFLINSAVGLQKGEKILIELHGSETTLMKALVQEAYLAGGKPFIHIFDYDVEGALVASGVRRAGHVRLHGFHCHHGGQLPAFLRHQPD